LSEILSELSAVSMPKSDDLIVGLATPDDGAILRIDNDRALIFSADFFAPVVDDPVSYGRIAASNALSDIYAMGGVPKMALNLVCWPEELPESVLRDVLKGGSEMVSDAGALLVGGHTVKDSEPKYGLAVIGFVDTNMILRTSGAKPGDLIVLTKALGIGVITTAHKRGIVNNNHLDECVKIMACNNSPIVEACKMVYPNVHAGTDVTGYGLLGHAQEMAEESECGIIFNSDNIPFMDGSLEYAERGIFSDGAISNEDFYSKFVSFSDDLNSWQRTMLFDPQTSGGLLVSVEAKNAEQLVDVLVEFGAVSSAIVGEVVNGKSGMICVK